MNVFREEASTDDNQTYKLYTADVWAVSPGREVRVVIVDYIDTDKKCQTHKVFFCTDLTKSAKDIFDIYRTRFQLEFAHRDGKQFKGLLTARPGTKRRCRLPSMLRYRQSMSHEPMHVKKVTIFQ